MVAQKEARGGFSTSFGADAVEGILSFCASDFSDYEVIGTGKDSTICRTSCAKLGGRSVAIKVYDKSRLSASKLRAVKRETAMMIYMLKKRVPLVTRFLGAFQDAAQITLVMEWCAGGDLLEQLLAEGRAMAESRVALVVAAPLLSTLQHLHALHIIHRDVKLENIFVAGDGSVRLGDFGLTMSMKQELAISPVGTVEYMAPEVVDLPPVEAVTSGAVRAAEIRPCTEKVDIWALGVTLYELLTGQLPFEGRDKAAIKAAIRAGAMRPFPPSTSPGCVAFVAAMLTRDPAARPSAAALLAHPFLAEHLAAAGVALPPPPPLRTASQDSADHLLAATPRASQPGAGVVVEVSIAGSFAARPGAGHAAEANVTLCGASGAGHAKGIGLAGPGTPRSPLEAHPSGSSGSSGWSTCTTSGHMDCNMFMTRGSGEHGRPTPGRLGMPHSLETCGSSSSCCGLPVGQCAPAPARSWPAKPIQHANTERTLVASPATSRRLLRSSSGTLMHKVASAFRGMFAIVPDGGPEAETTPGSAPRVIRKRPSPRSPAPVGC